VEGLRDDIKLLWNLMFLWLWIEQQW
jgi:hypothetical protein